MMRAACGRTTSRSRPNGVRPSDSAASRLAAIDRVDAGAEDLGEIGRAVGAEADDGRGQRRHAEAEIGTGRNRG